MSKKLLSLVKFGTILGTTLITNSVFAGGPELPPPCLPAIYIEANFGYEFSAWDDEVAQLSSTGKQNQARVKDIVRLHNSRGGFAWGGDVGYQFNPYLAVELGAYNLQTFRAEVFVQQGPVPDQNPPNASFLSSKLRFSNWIAYLAGKLILPITFFDGLDLFVKGGVAYRSGQFRRDDFNDTGVFQGTTRTSLSDFRPIIGAGVQYHLYQNWLINAQYLYVPDGNSRSQVDLVDSSDFVTTPASHIIVGGIGYMFCT